MPAARIYKITKNAMQSGKAKDDWLLEYVPQTPYFTEPLMGWSGMDDTSREIRLAFPSAAAAEKYAKKHKISYEIQQPAPSAHVKKAYADNFSSRKIK